MNNEKLISSTPILDNQTCPKGILSAHQTAKGVYAKLVVIEGTIEFVWEDTNEKIVIDSSKPFIIESQRKHHLNLLWEVKFKVEFYSCK